MYPAVGVKVVLHFGNERPWRPESVWNNRAWGELNYSYYNPVEDSIIIISCNKLSICDLTKESMGLFNRSPQNLP